MKSNIEQAEEMQDYLDNLKSSPKKQQVKKSFKNLYNSGIIAESGLSTDTYKYSRTQKEV